MSAPVILVFVADDATRVAVTDAMQRRYGADYDVVALGDLSRLPSVTATLESEARSVALALTPIGESGLAGLAVVSDHFPTARRVVLVGVGDTTVAADLNRALTLGTVDYYVGYPWTTAEEELYPVTSEALRVWTRDQEVRFDKLTVLETPDGTRGRAIQLWLARNGVAASLHTTDSTLGADLAVGALAGLALPAVLLYNGEVLANPADDALAEALGAATHPTADRYDVAIVGGGPAGLAAAVYAAAEGMRALVIEQYGIGGQAATSAKIRNYLGFRWGLSGRDLAVEASRQAEQLGAEFVVTRTADALARDGDDLLVTLSSGDVVRAGSVILTGGVAYRQLGVASVDSLIGQGVFYGAGATEVAAMNGRRVCVLGAGNSAGQAACALAKAGAEVTVLVRGDSLGASMSDYLVQQLTSTSNVTVRTGTQIVGAVGAQHLETLDLTSHEGTTTVPSDALFVYIGARPHTQWLADTVTLDRAGFVLTGRDLTSDRAPAWLETSLPGVFAAGDIRFGSIKRVAAAVGEGSTAAMLARDHLDR